MKISPDSIGYILYTSGSTGTAKGVIRTHRNDLRNIRHVTNSLGISDDDRITLLGSYSTGQGIQDIFGALLNGATLFPRNLKTEGFNGLADWLMQERITFYHSAATIFRHFVHDLSGRETFPDLRIVRLGGEPVSWRDVESYKKHFSETGVLANELSSSEASTFSQFLVNKKTEINMTVPVGYPVEDKEVLILDEKGDQLGPGHIGEIAVRSHFLSPGYWNRPDLTELAFIPRSGIPSTPHLPDRGFGSKINRWMSRTFRAQRHTSKNPRVSSRVLRNRTGAATKSGRGSGVCHPSGDSTRRILPRRLTSYLTRERR